MPVCPDCGEVVAPPDDAVEGEIIECSNCGLELEIISTNPLTVKIFEEEEK